MDTGENITSSKGKMWSEDFEEIKNKKIESTARCIVDLVASWSNY